MDPRTSTAGVIPADYVVLNIRVGFETIYARSMTIIIVVLGYMVAQDIGSAIVTEYA